MVNSSDAPDILKKGSLEERVLLLTALPKDAQLIGTLLTRAGIVGHTCRDLTSLCAEVEAGVGAVLLTDETLQGPEAGRLAAALAQQPGWSEIPFIVLTPVGRSPGAPARDVLAAMGNVSLLERPVRMPTLLSAIQAALRARRHQYRIRDYLEEQARLVEEIRRASQAKDNFLAMLAHELRNPLAPILTTAHLLKARAQDDPELEHHRELVERQARNMSRLLEDLLDVSRITRGKVILRKERVDLAEVTAHALDAVRLAVEQRGHQLSYTGVPEPLPADADPVRLEQVLVNLLLNAAKYTEPAGQIWVTLRRDQDTALVSVRDTGDGIPPELLPHVFDLFIQAERSLDRAQGGLGIGLTTAQHLVAMHGGTIEAFSEGLGRGSEFTVRLPLARPEDPRESPAASHHNAALGPRRWAARDTRVLVVDDNRDAAESMAQLLECWGYEVRVAGSGPAGLTAAAEYQPGVILLDIGMPGMDGYEVARRLRAATATREVVLVALTGYGQEQYWQLSREAGFDYHVVKPVEPEELKLLLAGTLTG